MNIDSLFPKAQTRPITVRQALVNCQEGEIKELTLPMKKVALLMKPGSYNVDNIKYAFNQVMGKTAGFMNTKLLSWEKYSCTLTKSIISESGIIHPDRNRYLTIPEAKRISSFPDHYKMIGKYKDQWARIGNSVPPLFMRAIAEQIAYIMFGGNQPEQTFQTIINYPEYLNAAWRQHLVPRAPNAPTVISTFAGGGGSSLGYSMAGYRELLAVEWDNNAVETFRLNFPDVPIYYGDIAKLSIEHCMELANLTAPGELDILDGSPPCQGFSTSGKRNFDDARNQLFREYVRLLRGLQPKVFVMENVSGMVKGKMKLIFSDIMRELKASGYIVSARLLNAMWFGVPQSRERLIFIGIRKDL